MDTVTIADALFTKTQQRVLGLLYGQPEQSFYFNELVRRVGMGRGTVRRELDRLVFAGLVVSSKVRNQNHYQANKACPIYSELVGIVRKVMTSQDTVVVSDSGQLVIAGDIKIARSEMEQLVQKFHIQRLVLFGSAARGELTPESDIDLLVEFKPGKSPSLGGLVEVQESFEKLFANKPVDIATPAILNNPYRKRAIEKDMKELYAA